MAVKMKLAVRLSRMKVAAKISVHAWMTVMLRNVTESISCPMPEIIDHNLNYDNAHQISEVEGDHCNDG